MDFTLLKQKLKQVEWVLFFTRITIGLVFLVWGLDKIFVPEHTVQVFSTFYSLDISNATSVFIGTAQLIIVALFLSGMYKSVTCLLVLVFHAASTFASFAKYLDPFNNLLFFTAWPMLAACLTLYLLRDLDKMLVYNTEPVVVNKITTNAIE